MSTVYALWGTPPDQAAFEACYDETHAPLAAKLPGIRERVDGTAEVSRAG
jgi:uncharacterized protein (TIGR02118 family)